jgi:hypothetical protein
VNRDLIFASGTIAPDGDATFDGVVDHNDFEVLFENFGKTGDWSKGDFNSDGIVNFADFQLLERNFGPAPVASDSPAPGEASVPEPELVFFAAGIALVARRRRRPAV